MGLRHPVGCVIFIGYFTQKSHIISGSFAKNDLQLKAFDGSLPPCRMRYLYEDIFINIGKCSCFMTQSGVHVE